MKLFGDPAVAGKARKVVDKLLAGAVALVIYTGALCSVIWMLGALKYFAFRLMGVA